MRSEELEFFYDINTAHIGSKYIRDANRSVCLLIVLHYRNQCPSDGKP